MFTSSAFTYSMCVMHEPDSRQCAGQEGLVLTDSCCSTAELAEGGSRQS